MKLLSIDTSSQYFSVAVMDDGNALFERSFESQGILSATIVPVIEEAIVAARLSLTDMDGFATGLGPGSFTSLRVGLSTVKALAMATGKPVIGVPSMDAIALNVGGEGAVCVICDARRGLVFACHYEKNGEDIHRLSDHQLCGVDVAVKDVPAGAILIGDAAHLVRQNFPGSHFRYEENHEKNFPSAMNIAKLALPRFTAGQYDDVHRLLPLYLYPEDCQIRGK